MDGQGWQGCAGSRRGGEGGGGAWSTPRRITAAASRLHDRRVPHRARPTLRPLEKRLELGDAEVAGLRAGPRDERVHARVVVPLHERAPKQRALRVADDVHAAA